MSRGREEELLPVAEAIADGHPVGWELVRAERPHFGPQLDRLQSVERIASSFQTMMTESGVTETTVHTPAGAMPDPGTPATWGGLRILEKIGDGGFGEVYRAFDPSLRREVALKLIRPHRAGEDPTGERLLEEARRLARVRHPNVLVVHGADRHDGRVGMWTDLLRGQTLEELLAQSGPLSAHEAALIGLDLCRALAAVHQAGLIHRDVKTTNVMREEGGRIVLMDFGTGWERPHASAVQVTADVSGTPLAMAPEQFRGAAPLPSADIYGLGVLLYRLVTGRFPIEAMTVPELIEKLRHGGADSLRTRRPDLPTDFVQVVELALDMDPGRRFQNAGAMERALLASLASPSPVQRNQRVVQRTQARSFALAALAVLAVLAVLGVLFLRRGARSMQGVAPQVGSATPESKLQHPEPLTAGAKLYREKRDSAPEELKVGDRISVGDELYLSTTGSEAMSVYVLNQDDRGHAYILFPSPDLDLKNPLSARVAHRLPGTRGGREVNWQVTSPGGRETYVVVASREPLKRLEHVIEAFPHARLDRPIELTSEAGITPRGTGGLALSPSFEGAPAKDVLLGAVKNALMEQGQAARDSWIWQIQLENPGP